MTKEQTDALLATHIADIHAYEEKHGRSIADINEHDDASTFTSDRECPDCGNDVTRWTGYTGKYLWHLCEDCGSHWGEEVKPNEPEETQPCPECGHPTNHDAGCMMLEKYNTWEGPRE